MQPVKNKFVDGENNEIICDLVYPVTGISLAETVEKLIKLHGPQVCLLPISGASAGGGIFQINSPGEYEIIGLHISPTPQPRISRRKTDHIESVSLDEIIIDSTQFKVYAGAAITLEQLNQALGSELGPQCKVLGADITSYNYAQVGATFMTGGMGPQRRYFSDSVDQIALHDGKSVKCIQGASLSAYAGTYGWSGLVTAVRCDYYETPDIEIAFALPVNSKPATLARLLSHLSPYTRLDFRNRKVVSSNGNSDIILGIEHITIKAMDPLFSSAGDALVSKRARQLVKKCRKANADGLVFINGYSNSPIEEFLLEMVDDRESDDLTIAGVNLDHTELFQNPEKMRAVREAVPAAARTQSPAGKYVYKAHTDANILLSHENLENTIQTYWQINMAYVASVQDYFDSTPGLTGEILVYGHLNPTGIDPHNRITFSCDRIQLYKDARLFLQARLRQFLQDIQHLCEESGSQFIGGEKSAGSEGEMFDLLGGPEFAPPALFEKYRKQIEVIRSASHMFNWRAIPPYCQLS